MERNLISNPINIHKRGHQTLIEEEKLIYKSKMDWSLTTMVWGTMLILLTSGSYALQQFNLNAFDIMMTFVLSILLPLFILWMWLTTSYVLTRDDLIVQFGPFKKTIALETIRFAQKSTNPLTSPALSFKRLEIVYGPYHSVLISPQDQEQFMEMLSIRCPQAKVIMDEVTGKSRGNRDMSY